MCNLNCILCHVLSCCTNLVKVINPTKDPFLESRSQLLFSYSVKETMRSKTLAWSINFLGAFPHLFLTFAFLTFSALYWITQLFGGVTGVAQLVERRQWIPWPEVWTPSGAQEKITSFWRDKNVVLTCYRCAQPPCVCIRTHKNDHVRTLKIL